MRLALLYPAVATDAHIGRPAVAQAAAGGRVNLAMLARASYALPRLRHFGRAVRAGVANVASPAEIVDVPIGGGVPADWA